MAWSSSARDKEKRAILHCRHGKKLWYSEHKSWFEDMRLMEAVTLGAEPSDQDMRWRLDLLSPQEHRLPLERCSSCLLDEYPPTCLSLRPWIVHTGVSMCPVFVTMPIAS
jgi:hypothetical protein